MPFNNWPPQYFAAVMGGGSSTPKHTVQITLTNGDSIQTSVAEGRTKTLKLVPHNGYLPPLSVTTTALHTYNKYTGTLVITMGTSDIVFSASCVAIPHTNDTITSFPLTYAEMAMYNLTHDQLAGV